MCIKRKSTNKESVSGETSARASLLIREVLLRMFEKVSRSLKYDSKFFLVHKLIIYIYYIPYALTVYFPIHVALNISPNFTPYISRYTAWLRYWMEEFV